MFVVPEKTVLILNEMTMHRKFPRVLEYITL